MLSALVYSCAKKEESGSITTEIAASKSTVKVGETVMLQVKDAPAGSLTEWTVVPATGATIQKYAWSNTNSVTFTAEGSYSVECTTKKTDCDSITGRSRGYEDTCWKNGVIKSRTSLKFTVSK